LRALGRRLSSPALDRANRDPNAALLRDHLQGAAPTSPDPSCARRTSERKQPSKPYRQCARGPHLSRVAGAQTTWSRWRRRSDFALVRAELGLDERHGPVFIIDDEPGRALLAVDPQFPNITVRELDGPARMLGLCRVLTYDWSNPFRSSPLRGQDSLYAEYWSRFTKAHGFLATNVARNGRSTQDSVSRFP
jgi:hypothetical protein